MSRDFLSKKILSLTLIMIGTLLLAGGCGDDNSSGTGDDSETEVTVQARSLSKEKFIKETDAICEKSKKQFDRGFGRFFRKSGEAPQSEQALLVAMVDALLIPTYEELIDQISVLGAPDGDEEEVKGFLLAIEKDLDNANEQPAKAFEGLTPFGQATKAASAYGLNGCLESLN